MNGNANKIKSISEDSLVHINARRAVTNSFRPAYRLLFVTLLLFSLSGCGLTSGTNSSGGPGGLTILTSNLPVGRPQTSYNASLSASGGKQPYTWSITSGNLPAGLTLTASIGKISGTPTQSGSFTFTAQVADSSKNSFRKQFSIPISTSGGSPGPGLDQYGGDLNHPCSVAATGYFFTYQDPTTQHWWFCDPLGNRFYMLGMEVVDEGDAAGYGTVMTQKYGDDQYGGYGSLISRLQNYGFNTVSDNSSFFALPVASQAGSGNPTATPFVWLLHSSLGFAGTQFPFKDLVSLQYAPSGSIFGGAAIRLDSLGDFFDPNFSAYASYYGPGKNPWGNGTIFPSMANLDASPWLIGVEIDDADDTVGFKTTKPPAVGVGPHDGWLSAAAAPVQVFSGRFKELFSDTVVHQKMEFANWLQQTSDKGPGYTSITALNTAWGANYSTFGTSGTAVTGEVIGTGNGTTTSFTHTLSHTVVDPYSVAVSVAGTLTTGDCPWFDNVGFTLHSDFDCGKNISANTGVMGVSGPAGQTITTMGTINYVSGALVLNFQTAPPAGAQITVNYVYGGWPHSMTGGTGLLDEDGTNTWFPADFRMPALLNSNPPQVDIDLDNFLYHLAGQYFSTLATAYRKEIPHHLILSQSFMGAYDRPVVLQQAAKYLDVLDFEDVDNSAQLTADYATLQKPMYLDERFIANPDSQFSSTPLTNTPCDNSYTCQPTQLARGQAYATQFALDFKLGFVIGWNYLQMTDRTPANDANNYGLFSQLDNAYDGIEDRTGPQTCGPELTVTGYICGMAPGNYGDFLSSVITANGSWH